ncbi:Signal transducer and activator of transcription 5A [Halotydeus destructor]|nr:Signal transducer and activator of transcription 5A [Halotydeus destructor]
MDGQMEYSSNPEPKMSSWDKLQELPNDAVQKVWALYGEHFPIEVRCALAQWLDQQPWDDLDPDNPLHEQYVNSVLPSIVGELQARAANSQETFVMKLKLSEAANNLQTNYGRDPFFLVRIIKQCLQSEMRIIQQVENQCLTLGSSIQYQVDPITELVGRFEVVNQRTLDSESELRNMQQEQEQLVIQHREADKIKMYIAHQNSQPNGRNPELMTRYNKEKEHNEGLLRAKAQALIQMRCNWIENIQGIFNLISSLQQTVLDEELIKWKRGQQLSGNGLSYDNNLDKIQEWCETLADLIWQNRSQLRKVENFCAQVPMNNAAPNQVSIPERLVHLNNQVTTLLSSLVTSTFIIEKQPPQVMKTNTRFTSTIRLLVGGRLNVHMSPPTVKVSIISENQANALLKNDKITTDSSGDILNAVGTMEYHQATKQLSVNFRNMQLRKIKRAEKKGTESVMDEKFALLFQSTFKVGGELAFQVWTLSLPVVVIVHGNQEPHAWATVTWDNAFAEPGRAPFVVPEKVPWNRVGEVLSMKFKSYVNRDLNKESLHFLAGKAFRNPNLADYDNMLLTWSQFCKEPLPNHNFTFWEWFYAILKVTREHLRALWTDGTIMGFVTKTNAEKMLLQRPNGTFLLRYSDSELGGLTIAWVERDTPERQFPEVFNLQPFTAKDFAIRALADRINDLKHLTYLYPEIAKDQAFSKYYTQVNDNQPISSQGYVKPMLVVQIPGKGPTGSLLDSYPNTPQSVIHNPSSPSESIGYHENHSIRSISVDHMTSATSSTDLNPQLGEGMSILDVEADFMFAELDSTDQGTINLDDLMGSYD